MTDAYEPYNVTDYEDVQVNGRMLRRGFPCRDHRCTTKHDSLYAGFLATPLNAPAPSIVWDIFDPRYGNAGVSCKGSNVLRTGWNGLPRNNDLLVDHLRADYISAAGNPCSLDPVEPGVELDGAEEKRAFAAATRVIFQYNERTWADHSLLSLLIGPCAPFQASEEPVHISENLMFRVLVVSTIDAVNNLKGNAVFRIHLHGRYWQELERGK